MPRLDKKKKIAEVFGSDTSAERQQLVEELELETPNPFLTVRLTKTQVQKLSEFIALLPFEDFRLLALYYSFSYSIKRIERETKRKQVAGNLAYIKDRLTQCMGLSRPIAELSWKAACERCIQQETYPLPPGT